MKIVWTPNPLTTVVELDDFDKKLLWHQVKIELLEESIGQAHFDLSPEHGRWLESIGKGRPLTAAVAEALRSLDYAYICGDEKRRDKSFSERIDKLTSDYAAELALWHVGDCTCVACSCCKCRAESLVGVDTIRGLGKHEASFIRGAFASGDGASRTLDEAIAYLRDHRPVRGPEWDRHPAGTFEAHVPRWTEEAKRAHAWLVEYQREHFGAE